ncbi:uncharacterized protein LOC121054890 [Oryza brachyantha]|uniref:DUF4220 domain-containing protein n=1 Tax=Oryza brachyantha TaxID=4533 RepID=J3KWC5_ORYBR|nr:uncharacterized protein LOC121054890 [Oryza brachyantha]
MDQVVASARNATQAGKQFASSSAGQLARIEGLVTVSCLLVGVLVICNSRRRHDGGALLRLLVWGAFMFNYPVISYTIGLMQSSSIHNELFVVWACFLLLLLGSSDTMTAFNFDDKSQLTRSMMNQALHVVYLIFLILYYKSQLRGSFLVSLFLLWSLSVVRLGLRVKAYLSTNRTRGLIRDNQIVHEYTMCAERESRSSPPRPGNWDTKTMDKYIYLVDGKEEEKVRDGEQIIQVATGVPETVDVSKVWQCKGKLLRLGGGDHGAARRRDLCLSFALFRMLMLRFAPDHVSWVVFLFQDEKYWDFVVNGLLADDQDLDRAFRVVNAELGFLFDFFYARYPSIKDTLAPDLAVYSAILATSLFTLFSPDLVRYQPLPSPGGNGNASNIIIHGFNLDLLITRLVIAWYIFLESYHFLAFIFSDWHKVKMLCRYVRNESWHKVLMEVPLMVLFHFNVTRYWKGTIGQYFLLDNIRPHWIKTFLSWFSIEAQALDAWLMTRSISLEPEVSHAVLRKLKNYEGRKITDGRMWLYRMGIIDLDLDRDVLLGNSYSRYIMKWHIATSICDMEDTTTVTQDHDVAMKLSGYCAYLLAFQPELVPDNTYKTTSIAHGTLQTARDFLAGCKSREDKYKKLIDLGRLKISRSHEGHKRWQDIRKSSVSEEDEDRKLKELHSFTHPTVLNEAGLYLSGGAYIAVYLVDRIKDVNERWKVLAAFWANMVLYIAPSNRAAAHAAKMATGGEFMTIIWALLTHANVVNPLQEGGANLGLHMLLEEEEKQRKVLEERERFRQDREERWRRMREEQERSAVQIQVHSS